MWNNEGAVGRGGLEGEKTDWGVPEGARGALGRARGAGVGDGECGRRDGGARRGGGRCVFHRRAGGGCETDPGRAAGVRGPGGAGGGGRGAPGRRGKGREFAFEPEVHHRLEPGEDAVDLAGDEDAEEGADEAFQQVLGEGESGRVVVGGCGGVLGLFGCE